MPFNPRQIPRIHRIDVQNISTDTNGRFRVTGELRNPRRAWVHYDGQGASGIAKATVLGMSNVNQAVVELDTPKSGTQFFGNVGSGTGYSGGVTSVWFEEGY